jgi:hypothetical protein
MITQLLCALILLTSFNAFSQIQSGGHPDGDGLPIEISEKQFLIILKKYEKLMNDVNEQWSKCSPKKEKKIKTLEDLYFEIFWRNLGLTILHPECDDSSEAKMMLHHNQINCFYNPEIKRNLSHFLNQPKVDHFLKFVEGVENIDQMRKYLKDEGVRK